MPAEAPRTRSGMQPRLFQILLRASSPWLCPQGDVQGGRLPERKWALSTCGNSHWQEGLATDTWALGGGYAGLGQQSLNLQWLVRCPCGPSPGAAGTVVSPTLPQLPGRAQLRLLPSLWASSQQGSHQPLKCLCRKSKNVPSLRLFTSLY